MNQPEIDVDWSNFKKVKYTEFMEMLYYLRPRPMMRIGVELWLTDDGCVRGYSGANEYYLRLTREELTG